MPPDDKMMVTKIAKMKAGSGSGVGGQIEEF